MDINLDKTMEKPKEIGTEIDHKNLDPISFFEKDTSFVFVYKKTEKLASAIYIVTNLLSDNEPIKWNLRKKMGELLSVTVNYKNISGSNQSDFVYNTKTRVLELVSLLEIAYHAGLVSSMNFSILKQEFSNLTDAFNMTRNALKESSYTQIPKAFFDASHESRESNILKNYYTEPLNSLSKTAYDNTKERNVVTNTANFKRSNRQNIIVSLLKKKKELTIKDISEVIRDCSEKTIQRELISFITFGVVKRTGERRWSRYSLV